VVVMKHRTAEEKVLVTMVAPLMVHRMVVPVMVALVMMMTIVVTIIGRVGRSR
jgi:hypothetical protein